jgi:hypothetical protein
MLNINKSSTRSTSTTEHRHSVSQLHRKVSLCPRCEMPMKLLKSNDTAEETFYFCSPCDSVRHPFDEDEEIELAVTARERGFFDRRLFSFSF